MINEIIYIFAMRLSAIEGANRQSITDGGFSELMKSYKENTRRALKLSRVSFLHLTILSPYRWLVKLLAQLQVTLVGSDNCPYWGRESFLSGAFSFSFLLQVFFSLSFKNSYPLRKQTLLTNYY